MRNEVVAELAAVLGALGATLALVPRARLALVAGLVVIAAAEGMLGATLLDGNEARALVASPARVGLAVACVLAVFAGAFLFVRFPAVVPVALLLAAPFRIPIEAADEKRFLLLPLYGVLTSAALALAYRAARRDDLPRPPSLLLAGVALFVGLAAVSLTWSQDLRSGTISLALALFPFALLVAVLARTPYRGWLPRRLAEALVALASAFALLGLWQLRSKDLFFARDVEAANANAGFFRVTAVFNDPSIYGRFLAVAIVVLLVALWLRRMSLRLGVGLVILLAAGLFFAYSQSSLVALFVGVLATTLAASGRRRRRMILAASAVLVLTTVGLVFAISRDDPLRRVTSGRSDLVANTTEVIREHPVFGVGIGAERRASREQAEAHGRRLGKASHTAVLTVAAELGALGIATLIVFVVAAGALFVAARTRDEALGIGLGAVFLVIFVHSIFYSGFFEDPLVWGTIGVAAAARLARPAVEAARPTPTPARLRPEPVAAARRSTPA
ncbi:MAG: O-antigen ligase family protein [Actinobacteria bacterium]|nr:O-antigen ligase family protein [Actinomycetota bacterium]